MSTRVYYSNSSWPSSSQSRQRKIGFALYTQYTFSILFRKSTHTHRERLLQHQKSYFLSKQQIFSLHSLHNFKSNLRVGEFWPLHANVCIDNYTHFCIYTTYKYIKIKHITLYVYCIPQRIFVFKICMTVLWFNFKALVVFLCKNIRGK